MSNLETQRAVRYQNLKTALRELYLFEKRNGVTLNSRHLDGLCSNVFIEAEESLRCGIQVPYDKLYIHFSEVKYHITKDRHMFRGRTIRFRGKALAFLYLKEGYITNVNRVTETVTELGVTPVYPELYFGLTRFVPSKQFSPEKLLSDRCSKERAAALYLLYITFAEKPFDLYKKSFHRYYAYPDPEALEEIRSWVVDYPEVKTDLETILSNS